ncbi:hypothetical protein EUZ93_02080 [Wolbachia pipientis]|nr:hypothetical protein [Wolbachia pipientis]
MSTSNFKISIAALSLYVSTVAIYIHLPYVIAAVSGSGAIEAVPLAIFAVSAIVALVSVIYLIRLAVSRAGDKKKIDFSGEESGHTASQVPQEKSVKQDSRSQTEVARAIPQNNNASSPSPSGGAPPPPPPPPAPSSKGTPLPKEANVGNLLYNFVGQKFPDEIIYPSSDGNLSDPHDSNGWGSSGDEKQDKQSFASTQADAPIEVTYETDSDKKLRNCENEPLNFQPDNEKESERPDSGYGPSPLDFKSEAEKPQVPASLQEEPSVTKVNNVDLVNSRV